MKPSSSARDDARRECTALACALPLRADAEPAAVMVARRTPDASRLRRRWAMRGANETAFVACRPSSSAVGAMAAARRRGCRTDTTGY